MPGSLVLPSSAFLTLLPPELRNLVYDYALDWPQLSTLLMHVRRDEHPKISPAQKGPLPALPATCSSSLTILETPTILLLNRQITQEALRVLRQKPLILDSSLPSAGMCITEYIGPTTLQHVRLMVLDIALSQSNATAWLRMVEVLLDLLRATNSLTRLVVKATYNPTVPTTGWTFNDINSHGHAMSLLCRVASKAAQDNSLDEAIIVSDLRTGATGYIGGDILYELYNAHPDYEYTALVRDSERGALVAAAFPKIKLIYGTLDDLEVIEKAASEADIVVHTADASDNAGAAKAIAKGILAGHSKTSPGFWLHTSGTGILCWRDSEAKTYGEAPSSKPYDDLEAVEELTNLPDTAFHRDIDKLVLEANAAHPDVIKTAIVCPPTIYGPGRGPGNQQSRQVNTLVKIMFETGQAPRIGKGQSEWNNVHVQDLSALFRLLVEKAVAMSTSDGSIYSEIFGQKGYYLAENGHHVWGEISQKAGKIAYEKGYIQSADVVALDLEYADKRAGFEAVSWGLNSRGAARRAREYLGWTPKQPSLEEILPEMVVAEAKAFGLEKGYREKAAGTA
ncbi:hypothetical protein BP6252_08613 [Coleophoma cylindrospora]|uniref:NAD(P)-binding domain-containing protein n=1 Tax=Coleophoma cylindrospora TaxID=1849047 RepID=A0A3D8R6C9_9HELO|nr:hypothetical protein BP6252_08613 [Coleophoma cylindrospora]